MLTVEERQKLRAIIADLYEFRDGGTRDRRVLIEMAGLHRFRKMNLEGLSEVVAGDLILQLENYGDLPERPIYHALGALLSYLLTLEELPLESASFLAYLIVHYSLVHQPAYTDNLRVQYGTEEPSVRQQVLPSPQTIPKTEEPAFAIPLLDEQALERIIHSKDNFLDIYLLAGAIYSAQAVCQIERRGGANVEEKALGTGFLIGPDLLLTNKHVVEHKRYLSELIAHFDYRIDAYGVPLPGREIAFQPDFYFSSDSRQLDYALLRLMDRPLKQVDMSSEADMSYLDLLLQGKHRGYLLLAGRLIKARDRLNIIQHPAGKPMKVVLTQNYVISNMTETRVQYVIDTMDGSSGSPVFNQNWEVVALHHSGEPYPAESAKDLLKKSWKGHFRMNEGIPIRAILKDFRQKGLDRYLPRY